MAKATELLVDVNVRIPDETARRCLRILEMWMQDNPDAKIEVDKKATTDGFVYYARIIRNEMRHD